MGGSCALGLVLSGILSSAVGFIPDFEILILRRGDANNDAIVNQTDAIFISNYLFLGGPEPPCMNQADANDDGQVDTSDTAFILNWLYNGGSPPPYPGPYNSQCAEDPEPSPGCLDDPCN